MDAPNSLYSLEDLGIEGFDVVSADGVVNLRLGSRGTYVLNKQTPTRQLWLSSPVSGPWHYEWVDGKQPWQQRRCVARGEFMPRRARFHSFEQKRGAARETGTFFKCG